MRRTSKRFENGSLRSREIPVTFRSQPKGVCKARGEEIKRRPKQRRTKKCMIKLLKERIHKKKKHGLRKSVNISILQINRVIYPNLQTRK